MGENECKTIVVYCGLLANQINVWSLVAETLKLTIFDN